MGVAKPLLSHTAATPAADRSLESHDRQALSESDHRHHDARTIKAQRPAQQTIRHFGALWPVRWAAANPDQLRVTGAIAPNLPERPILLIGEPLSSGESLGLRL